MWPVPLNLFPVMGKWSWIESDDPSLMKTNSPAIKKMLWCLYSKIEAIGVCALSHVNPQGPSRYHHQFFFVQTKIPSFCEVQLVCCWAPRTLPIQLWCMMLAKKSKPRGWYGLFVIIFVYFLLLLVWGHTILNHISYNAFIPLMIPSNPVLLATGLTLPASLCLLSWRVVFSGPTPTMGWLSVLLGGFRNRLPKHTWKSKNMFGDGLSL